jgi:hypothetical protein
MFLQGHDIGDEVINVIRRENVTELRHAGMEWREGNSAMNLIN